MAIKKTLGMLSLVATLCGASTMAVAAQTATPAASAPAVQKISLLNGKFAFDLQGYEVQPVPGGAPGKMYVNKQDKRVLIIGEEPVPAVARGGSDADFLEGMKDIRDKQKQVSPDYKVISEKTEKVKGLDVYHIEATDIQGDSHVIQTTLLAVADHKFTVIQIFSGVSNKAAHQLMVNKILAK
ncbi:hypothetical protein N5923_22625 [Erwiniaceae bacterium BAC15a-03b]|uniref:DUF1795 domain-containing protein n=1 Tax=Winslowiella arboricola TaxID=2978220 RepID=A0A9J6PUE6_9GAMM|nr:hypothetical protein [Winslowiella arboricola]MCU5775309.1 hypothetical protein [Winslowiella arboricola]MCU5780294.1 hypothetical protein [Winslowiella arboricola]